MNLTQEMKNMEKKKIIKMNEKTLKKFKPVKLKRNQNATIDWTFSFNPNTIEMIKIERKVKIKRNNEEH